MFMSGGVEAGLTVTIVLIVCLIGVCTAEPHVISEDEWNTTARNLAAGEDPRQSPDAEPQIVYAVVPNSFMWMIVGVLLLSLVVYALRRVWRKKGAKK